MKGACGWIAGLDEGCMRFGVGGLRNNPWQSPLRSKNIRIGNRVKPGSESKPSGFLRAFDSDPEFYGSSVESATWAVRQDCHGLLRAYVWRGVWGGMPKNMSPYASVC
jgi:hypothetical protein